MSRAKLSRDNKRQLGQFLTPSAVAAEIVRGLEISPTLDVLEPSFGAGAFVFALIDAMGKQAPADQVTRWVQHHLHGCEIDATAFCTFSEEWTRRGLGDLPPTLECGDFLRWLPTGCDRTAALNPRRYFASRLESFDLIIGNPPFGGSIDPSIQDEVDAIFGIRNGMKIKKETYALFLVKCLDLLKPGGTLRFICSDTILTIPTMRGLRHWFQDRCDIDIAEVPGYFDDTAQDLVLVTVTKRNRKATQITVFGSHTSVRDIEATENLSWRVNGEFARYFSGQTLGGKMVASSGMTVGNNALFLRRISNGAIEEPYDFAFAQEPITLAREIERARLGKMSQGQAARVAEQERLGEMRRVVSWTPRPKPELVPIPHEDYRYYNKATSDIVYSPPDWTIFWRDAGDYVYTFKKAGNWYLHGVGGKPFFGREGLTWALIASRLRMRWLPSGYILDSGAPCAFLRPGVSHDELLFIMGWTLTDLCTRILKNVINHTRNIQSKDFERLPYPVWVTNRDKEDAVSHVEELINRARDGKRFDFESGDVRRLNSLYDYRECAYSDLDVQAANSTATEARLF
jgi:hypothetical protein